MEWYFCLLILAESLLQMKAVNVYYIQPNNHSTYLSSDVHDHYTLQGYINHTYESYPYNNSKVLLLPGKHILKTDFIIQNAYKFTIHGNNSIIYCQQPSLGIAFVNVTLVMLKNIELINCAKNYSLHGDSIKDTKVTIASAVYFNQCTDVNVSGIYIMIQSGTNGIIAVNINKGNKISVFQNITIAVNCTKSWIPSSGIIFYHYDDYSKPANCIIRLSNYKYKISGLCKDTFALDIATNQTAFDVSIQISDTNFRYLNNVGILKYHGKSCEGAVKSTLRFRNCSIEHNHGDTYLRLFRIVISNHRSMYNFSINRNNIGTLTCNNQINIIDFRQCTFVNNSNISSILYILLLNSLSANVLIELRNTVIVGNHNIMGIIKSKSNVNVLWQLTHYITLRNTTISSNNLSHNLISTTNGLIKFTNSVIKNNKCNSIIKLYFSLMQFQDYSEFSSNQVIFILNSIGGSYSMLREYSKLNITNNIVHSVMRMEFVLNDESKPVCYFQFISNNNLKEHINEDTSLNYEINLVDNVYSIPASIIEETDMDYKSCVWLNDTAFSSTNITWSVVYSSKVINKVEQYANKSSILMTNLTTICPCSNNTTYNCSQRYIGTVFPGQILTVKLMLLAAKSELLKAPFITALTRINSMPHACHLLNASEIMQEHQSHDECIEHSYTIWSELPECEVYLSTEDGITETMFVNLKPCPAGFNLCRKSGACYCDPTLYPFIISCNVNDKTILRPANSWVSAYHNNQKHEYKVSTFCPYSYCIPHPVHLNLSMPDSQCQFDRTGLLCGQCQQGLSNIFGSSRCKQCSNFYLFIIIPIAVAGVVLVMMLFIFNLTITSGTINTFIFYVNIISINYSLFFPECHSIDCLLLSLSNLDLGFDMCFYNGMDGYFKALLQLVFPLYLIFIAFLLIIGSRHSVMMQRLTSQRGLHVLATLFLLSYTKFLLTVCQVLFFYSEIIHLPSKQITLVWSLDVTVPLFGVRFLIAFIICLVIFVILLHFNILLLFARQLLRFKCINTFKPLLDAYFGPYKDNHYYWTGLQLILRSVFFGLSAFHKNVRLSLISGNIALGVLLSLQGLMSPFKSRYKNIQETLVIFNLQAVYALALYSEDDSSVNIQIIQVLILLALVYFFIVFFYHCLMSIATCSRIILKVRNKLAVYLKVPDSERRNTHGAAGLNSVNSHNKCVSGNYHELQESLIALDN